MKYRQIFFLWLGVMGLFSCAKDELPPQVLKTSEHELRFSADGGEWLLTVNSNAVWQVSGETEWCTVSQAEGENTAELTISVSPNEGNQVRLAQLQISGDRSRSVIAIQQDTVTAYHQYELPVVFHIIYSNIGDTVQNIKAGVVAELIEKCNQLYEANGMGVALVAAAQDPDGKTLEVPGIHRILRSNSAYQSCTKFMDEKNTKDAELIWNPNKYVNVFVYTFLESNTLGISHLPFTPRQNGLSGLTSSNYYFTRLPEFPYGISLNNTYIYEVEAYTTLAHELGHYLGLYHVFVTKDCADTNETDYCEDIPSYNRPDYEKWLLEKIEELTPEERFQRTGCKGESFISYNVMDYDYSYMNQFTANQYERVRHVLQNSPLIPGPKHVLVTKGMTEDDVPPPVIIMP